MESRKNTLQNTVRNNLESHYKGAVRGKSFIHFVERNKIEHQMDSSVICSDGLEREEQKKEETRVGHCR